MNCSLLLILVLIGLVAGDGGWKRNQEYTYKLMTRTLTAFPRSNKQWFGAIFRARLSIAPISENLLIGKISEAQYAEVQLSNGWNSNLDDSEMQYQQLPFNKPFEIHLRNGQIRSLSVDRTMTVDQTNQLKAIVSQLQVDTNAQKEDNNNVYKTTEQTVIGNCETTYEISLIPEYLIRSNPDWVPLPELKGNGEFIDIVKTRNYNKCNERVGRLNTNQIDNSEVSRIILSGSSNDYTIQSSVTTNKVAASPNDRQARETISYIDVRLESIEQNSRYPQIQSRKLVNTGDLTYNTLSSDDLTYKYNTLSSDSQYSRRQMDGADSLQVGVTEPQRKASSCYSLLTPVSTMCFHDYGTEWEADKVEACGLGHRAYCVHTFVGCETTPCTSTFINGLCVRNFGNRLPVVKGLYVDCFPGFIRNRCCPKSYE